MSGQWVTLHATELRLLSFVLGAFSVVFGGKALGRFSQLTERGGFYSSVLVAIPAALFLGTSFYVTDVVARRYYSMFLSQFFHQPITSLVYAAVGGVYGLVTALGTPGMYRMRSLSGGQIYDMTTTGGIIGTVMYALVQFAFMALGVAIAAQYVMDVLGWLGGGQPSLVLILVLAVPSWIAGVGVGIYTSLKKARGKEGDIGALGCVLYVVSLVAIPIAIADIAALVYLTRVNGWGVLLGFAVGLIAFVLLIAIRWSADRLSTKALTSIFAIPGAIAVIIQFVVANANLLPS